MMAMTDSPPGQWHPLDEQVNEIANIITMLQGRMTGPDPVAEAAIRELQAWREHLDDTRKMDMGAE